MFKEEDDDDEEEDLKKSTQSELLHWLTGGIGGDTGDTYSAPASSGCHLRI